MKWESGGCELSGRSRRLADGSTDVATSFQLNNILENQVQHAGSPRLVQMCAPFRSFQGCPGTSFHFWFRFKVHVNSSFNPRTESG